MTIRSQLEALLRATSSRKADDPHPKGPKYLYLPVGTVAHVNTGSKIKGKSEVHRVYHRVPNPKRQGKGWK